MFWYFGQPCLRGARLLMFLRSGVNSHITHEALLSTKPEPIYQLGHDEYIAKLAPVGTRQFES
jgi:hypothetical protein